MSEKIITEQRLNHHVEVLLSQSNDHMLNVKSDGSEHF